ncbi:uncharacterized protein LOC143188108 [Calliopsis andreniformis]|uniref:uncharacterized protein LOC143188108 n=1 Tax=Calliopsis andreniformis TaxID=337506 RepID=UPI003FCD85C9
MFNRRARTREARVNYARPFKQIRTRLSSLTTPIDIVVSFVPCRSVLPCAVVDVGSCLDAGSSSTALHWAAKHGDENIVKLIAGTYRAYINSVNETTVSAFIIFWLDPFVKAFCKVPMQKRAYRKRV